MADRPTPHRDPRKNAHLVDYLARERHGWLCAVARRAGAEPQSVDDVVQGALLDVLRSFPGPHETAHVAAYAARCVQGRVWKLHRRQSRKESRNVALAGRQGPDASGAREELGLADPSAADPLELVIAAEASSDRRALLDALPEDQRTIVILKAAGLDTAEVAERMGLSQRGVRKRLEKANRRLRDLAEGAQ